MHPRVARRARRTAAQTKPPARRAQKPLLARGAATMTLPPEAERLLPTVQSSASRIKQGSFTNDTVLTAEVPWATFQTAGIITKEQLELIYELDKQPLKKQVAQFEARGAALVDVLRELLAGVSNADAIQYILALLDELLEASPSLALPFHALLHASKGYTDAFAPLMQLLTRSSPFILEKATQLLGAFDAPSPRLPRLPRASPLTPPAPPPPVRQAARVHAVRHRLRRGRPRRAGARRAALTPSPRLPASPACLSSPTPPLHPRRCSAGTSRRTPSG